LLLRSTEAKPPWLCFVLTYTPIYMLCLQGIKGAWGVWVIIFPNIRVGLGVG